jgi:WAS family protein
VVDGGYGPLSPHYQQTNYQQGYDEGIYNSEQIYNHGQGPLSSESLYGPGTPTRSKPRPSQPPPAPPSSGSGGTPNVSNANTPTRGRSMSTGRDTLPPPPPIPEGMQSPQQTLNGGAAIAAKLLARSHSTSRAGSPQLGHDQNSMIMQQLNNQINNLNSINMQMNVLNSMNDLPPPPPIPEQMSPKPSPQILAPPPPPPPPLPIGDIPLSPPKLPNGDLTNMNGMINMGQVLKTSPPKKIIPPVHDSRTDLMKAIRDGIKLRKVEKIEAKEIERSTGLHDVAYILARRVAIELSESETSDSDDSEGWQEPNETSA